MTRREQKIQELIAGLVVVIAIAAAVAIVWNYLGSPR
jgi:hypothetical protein